ncbi:hypothetical protein Ddye_024737 [Dipteronia dyeriana]|uniref:RNase H type-1 domain-containing protein n=1 Tax=Dipteronia dyeriana TaxID=168575 RepID=A0AAD9WT93_9ROSI|nr:hypothetical protein Ddye_024737 [Dipteronia dyeriana]
MVLGSPGAAGIGGVLCESNGKILYVFLIHVGFLDAIATELHAIHKACQLISEKGTDFGNLQLVHLVYDIRLFLKNSDKYDIRYMPRDSNAFADFLARDAVLIFDVNICFRGDPPTRCRFRDPKGYRAFSSFQMSARKEIVPTAVEAVAPYFAGLSEGGNLYVQDDRVHLSTVPDPTSSADRPED